MNPETAESLKYWLQRGGVEINGKLYSIPALKDMDASIITQLLNRSRKQ